MMNQFPYTNFHDVNLDWLIKQTGENTTDITKVESEITTINSELDTLQNEIENISSLYLCTFGVTTNSEIESALNDKKLPICIYNGHIYVISQRVSANRHRFGSVYRTESEALECLLDSWLTQSDTFASTTYVNTQIANAAEVFWAEYGVTSPAEIHAANAAGKVCALIYGNSSSIYYLVSDDGDDGIYFGSPLGEGSQSWILVTGDPTTWELPVSRKIPIASNVTPMPLGTVSPGTKLEYSRRDHVHPMPDAGEIPYSDSDTYPSDTMGAEFQSVFQKMPGKNLINEAIKVVGAISGNSGEISTELAFADYLTYDFTELEPNTDYVYTTWYNGNIANGRKIYLLYDADKNPIGGTYVNQAYIYAHYITNTNAKYIRCSCDKLANIMLEKGTSYTSYEPYQLENQLNDNIKLSETMKNEISALGLTDNLNGKKWACFGDSFTAYTNKQFTDGIYAGQDMTYPRLISLRTGIIPLFDFCLSGRTLAYPADGTFANSATNPSDPGYYQNVPADVDYITIMLGTNDNQHNTSPGEIPLGTNTDATTSTYYGAWNTVLSWFRTNRPFAHIGIVITNGIGVQSWVEAIEEMAKKYGYPVLNLNGDSKTPVFIRAYNPNVPAAVTQIILEKQAVDYDGSQTGTVNTHPNYQTHELESYIFENWLRTL